MGATKSNSRLSRRFLPSIIKSNQTDHIRDGLKQIFQKGYCSTIKVNLEFNGWTPEQIKMIQDLLHAGCSLSQSLN